MLDVQWSKFDAEAPSSVHYLAHLLDIVAQPRSVSHAMVERLSGLFFQLRCGEPGPGCQQEDILPILWRETTELRHGEINGVRTYS